MDSGIELLTEAVHLFRLQRLQTLGLREEFKLATFSLCLSDIPYPCIIGRRCRGAKLHIRHQLSGAAGKAYPTSRALVIAGSPLSCGAEQPSPNRT